MNYDEARELKEGGWHWTSMNDGRVRTAWPCRRLRYPDSKIAAATGLRNLGPNDFETCEPHATREEAERHFYDACLADTRDHGAGDWSGCRVCDAPTKTALGNLGLGRMFSPEPLCDEHRTREHLAELSPFHGGIALIHS